MPIQWKLLIALLIVALPPLMIISWFDHQSAKGISRDLVSAREEAVVDQAGAVLRLVAESNARALGDALESAAAEAPARAEDAAARAARRIAATLAGYDGTVSVIARHAGGRLAPLAATNGPDQSALIAALPAPIKAGETTAGAGLHRFAVDGRDRLTAYAPVPRTALAVLISLPMDTLSQAARTEAGQRVDQRIEKQLVISGVGVLFLLAAAVVLSLIIARSITRPVKDLTATARRIADGDLNARSHIETGDELEDLGETFNEMLPKLNDRIRMREALGLAMEVQQKLLPNEAPTLEGLDIAGRSIYCDETGGDYFDFLNLSELAPGKVGVAVGDVTGHGIAAALLMATARALLRARATVPGSLSETVTAVNHHLSGDAHAGRFMTLFYGVFDTDAKTLNWVNAGHAPALIYTPGADDFSELEGGDIPLGIDGGWVYQEAERTEWSKGEVIAMGTDGIWEMRAPNGEMFGMERLKGLIRDNADRSADTICNAVAEALRDHQSGREQEDDVTLVIVKLG